MCIAALCSSAAQPTFQSSSRDTPAVGSVSSVHSLSLAGLEPQREVDEQQVRRRHSSCASEPLTADSRKVT